MPTSIHPAPENHISSEREFLSLKAAAEKIGCTRRFLETRIEDGELSVFRPSRRLVRIARAELDRWVDQYTRKGGVS